MFYVYSLKCKDGYYVGCTDDIIDRLNRHTKGNVPATANRLPFEKYLKSGSGRAFINKHFAQYFKTEK
ncbi:MAG: GIY-YIG nuclease family protein [Candidatus Zambryskibacteria bacterium]|nr:GIY-YIG nuclease family protein [Candidatus Zambryskibacteria bacterium]